ncbi:NmrA-like family domain-containing protein, partial [Lachnellula suecica]
MAKTIVVIAVTGNQNFPPDSSHGSSVADVFLKAGWKVKGVTRNPSQPSAEALAAKGVEILKGDANDTESIKAAVQGADVVFGNTVFSDALATPKASIWEMCYNLEFQQGKNIVDAVASVGCLDRFIWSSLSNATKWSKGEYKGVYHFDSKAHVVDYINETYPKLAKKLSILQMGLFVTNWRWGQVAVPWGKQPDGSIVLRIPGSEDVPIPLVLPKDTGYYVWALNNLPVGTNMLAFSDRLLWTDYVKLWSKVTGVPAIFEKTTVAEHSKLAPDGNGEELAEMYAYAQDYGYDGSDPSLCSPR